MHNITIVEESTDTTPTVLAVKAESLYTTPLPDKALVVNESQESSISFRIGDFWVYSDLLYFLTWRDIKVRYKQAVMGAIWAVIQPLFMVIAFAIFFGIFIRVPTEGMPYIIFFYCGLIPWTFFANAVSTGSMSVLNSSNLITKVYFPRIFIPTAAVGALLVDLAISCVILIGLMVYYGVPFTWTLMMLPLLLSLTVLLALGFGTWLAALTIKYRDVKYALPFVLQFWMFLTPIIYPLSVVPGKWHWAMYLNPLTGVTEGMRSALAGRNFDWLAILITSIITLVVLVYSNFVFRRTEKSFADLV